VDVDSTNSFQVKGNAMAIDLYLYQFRIDSIDVGNKST